MELINFNFSDYSESLYRLESLVECYNRNITEDEEVSLLDLQVILLKAGDYKPALVREEDKGFQEHLLDEVMTFCKEPQKLVYLTHDKLIEIVDGKACIRVTAKDYLKEYHTNATRNKAQAKVVRGLKKIKEILKDIDELNITSIGGFTANSLSYYFKNNSLELNEQAIYRLH